MHSFDLRDRDFIGFTVSNSALDLVYKNSRYLVHIPELLPFVSPTEGIWCYNGLNKLQIVDSVIIDDVPVQPTYEDTIYGSVIHRLESIDPTTKLIKQGMSGSYTPLLPSVKYFIKFIENDINSGIIHAPLPYDIECEIEKNISIDEASMLFTDYITGEGDEINILDRPDLLKTMGSSRPTRGRRGPASPSSSFGFREI